MATATKLTSNAKLVWKVISEHETARLAEVKMRTGLSETAINAALNELAAAGHIQQK